MPTEPPRGYAPYQASGPFLELVGPVWVRGQGGDRMFGLRVEERHLNVAGAAQGGLLVTLVDFALGRAVHAEAEGEDRPLTVSLTTDFLRAVDPGDWLEARTRVERVGGKLAFADCSLTVAGREVVRARGVFAVVG